MLRALGENRLNVLAVAVPVAWVLAGGYTEDMSKIVRVHLGTFDAWREVFGA